MTISIPTSPHRLERLRAWMDEERIDCAVVSGADHVNHLCGYWRYYGGPSALVVPRDGTSTLVAMLDEVPVAESMATGVEVLGYGERGFGINLDPITDLMGVLAAVPAVAGASRIGFASEIPGVEAALAGSVSAQIVDAAKALWRIRLIKDSDEVEKIHTSYELCWLAQQAVADAATPGASEIELFTVALSTAQIASGGPIEFLADLLSGPNASAVCCPIHVAGRRRVEEGDAVVADIVVRTAGYWGDTAETHSVGANDEVAEIRAFLLDVLEQARQELVPGATGAEIFGRMHRRVVDAYPGGELPHHGGHALGLTSFEDPHIIPSDTIPLEAGMVLAVEPGVYFPGRLGARVENVFIVTPDGGAELRSVVGSR